MLVDPEPTTLRCAGQIDSRSLDAGFLLPQGYRRSALTYEVGLNAFDEAERVGEFRLGLMKVIFANLPRPSRSRPQLDSTLWSVSRSPMAGNLHSDKTTHLGKRGALYDGREFTSSDVAFSIRLLEKCINPRGRTHGFRKRQSRSRCPCDPQSNGHSLALSEPAPFMLLSDAWRRHAIGSTPIGCSVARRYHHGSLLELRVVWSMLCHLVNRNGAACSRSGNCPVLLREAYFKECAAV